MQRYQHDLSVIEDGKTAKDVTFHPEIRLRSVTLDGDVYDPSGSLSGGSKPSTSGVLAKMKRVKEIRCEYQTTLEALDGAKLKLKTFMGIANKLQERKQLLELKAHELDLLEQQLSSNANAIIIKQFEGLQVAIEECMESVKTFENQFAQAVKNQKKIQSDMDEYSGNKESKLKAIEIECASLKKVVASRGPAIIEKQMSIDILNEEIKNYLSDIELNKSQSKDSIESVKLLQSEEKELKSSLAQLKVF